LAKLAAATSKSTMTTENSRARRSIALVLFHQFDE
jgi:hypothetical protein